MNVEIGMSPLSLKATESLGRVRAGLPEPDFGAFAYLNNVHDSRIPIISSDIFSSLHKLVNFSFFYQLQDFLF